MCEVCQTYKLTTFAVNRFDPTHTTVLRNMFNSAMMRRFKELTNVINKAIIDQDCFGMQEITTLQMTLPHPRAFNFALSTERVEAFMKWLQEQIDKGILETITIPESLNVSEYAWTNQYVLDSYKRGIIRARVEMRKRGMNIPDIESSGGINAIMNTPFHLDRVGLLFIRVFSDLKGITDDMANQIGKVLAQGMIDGDGPRMIARKLVATINGTGMGDLGITDTLGRFIPARRRAEMLARTEIIRAHHLATINEYRSWGVVGVNVLAEFRTAGDDRVCEECMALEAGGPYTLDEAEGMVPAHPMCRCMCLPFFEGNEKIKKYEPE